MRYPYFIVLFQLMTFGAVPVMAQEVKEPVDYRQFDNFESYQDIGYDQAYRPLFQFTSKKNWINDPNGLVYYDGEYHLFFQHNPLGMGWGNMIWGHAVSTDMVHWKQRPHAIKPYGKGYIFSGTGVVDHNNSLGKQVGSTKTLVFMYSYALDERQRFGVLPAPDKTEYYQAIAYSTDKGRTFQLLNGGAPVIPFQGRDVDPKGTERDPKIFWHEESQKWITVLWMGESTKGLVRFFSSDDLQNWKFESDIRKKWAHECFELFKLPVLDANGDLPKTPKEKWVLFDGNLDYEVGTFDGKTFINEQKVRNHLTGHWNAAQTFNDMPDGRRVLIGWLKKAPFFEKKMPFSQQLSFPATMHIRDLGDGIQLYRWPIKEIENLYGREWVLPADCELEVANKTLQQVDAECTDLHLKIIPKQGQDLTMKLRGSTLTYHADKNQLHFLSKTNKDKSPKWDNLSEEEKKDRKNWRYRYDQYTMKNARNKDGVIDLRILIDRASFEIFLNEGITTLTHSEIHDLENRELSFQGKGALIHSMNIHELKSSWK
jgi:fructan beta-fructosidase